MMPQDSTPLIPLAAIGALALGHKIDAIKIVRQENSLSLKEAKEAVEAYQRAHPDLALQPSSEHKTSTSLWLSSIVIFIATACITWILLMFYRA
ncbi:MAG: ribosomal protein L7/L12 [Pseudomonadales bacterium]|nr:ribosomal protein L7/L12 [Pseudomonadales bacterium]